MRRISTCLIVCAALGTAAPAQADVITYWNDVVVQALTQGCACSLWPFRAP